VYMRIYLIWSFFFNTGAYIHTFVSVIIVFQHTKRFMGEKNTSMRTRIDQHWTYLPTDRLESRQPDIRCEKGHRKIWQCVLEFLKFVKNTDYQNSPG
jgi:hypothetical protein